MSDTWPAEAPSNALYLCFTPDADEDEAASRFWQKYEHWPQFIFECLGLLRLGPVREEGD